MSEAKPFFQICRRQESRTGLPCVVDIYVLANLHPPCEACESRMDEARKFHGWQPIGAFYRSDRLDKRQVKDIDAEIAKATGATP